MKGMQDDPDHMTGAQFDALSIAAGLTRSACAGVFAVSRRRVHDWVSGRESVPPRIAVLLRVLAGEMPVEEGLGRFRGRAPNKALG